MVNGSNLIYGLNLDSICPPVCNPEFTGIWTGGGTGLCSGTVPNVYVSVCDYDGIAIYLGNENAVTDDDIEIRLNGETVGTYVDEIGSCDGLCGQPFGYCASPSASTTSMVSFSQLLEKLNINLETGNLNTQNQLWIQ